MLLGVPRWNITWKLQLSREMGLHGSVNRKWIYDVHGCSLNCAQDKAGPGNYPCRVVLAAVFIQEVFLWKVEVPFDTVPRICFVHWCCSWTKVEAIVLGTSLQKNTLRFDRGEGQGIKKVGQ